jgi:hypothetical protein
MAPDILARFPLKTHSRAVRRPSQTTVLLAGPEFPANVQRRRSRLPGQNVRMAPAPRCVNMQSLSERLLSKSAKIAYSSVPLSAPSNTQSVRTESQCAARMPRLPAMMNRQLLMRGLLRSLVRPSFASNRLLVRTGLLLLVQNMPGPLLSRNVQPLNKGLLPLRATSAPSDDLHPLAVKQQSSSVGLPASISMPMPSTRESSPAK